MDKFYCKIHNKYSKRSNNKYLKQSNRIRKNRKDIVIKADGIKWACGRRSRTKKHEYDLEVVTLSALRKPYGERLAKFTRLGLISKGVITIHLTLLLNPEDTIEGAIKLMNDVRSDIDVDIFIPDKKDHIFKHNAYLLKQLDNSFVSARWYIRQDDDSITDCDALVKKLDELYGNSSVYLISNPIGLEHTGDEIHICRDMGYVPCMHEYEAGIFSKGTFRQMRKKPDAITFLQRTLYVAGAGDRTWVLASHIAGISPTVINFISKDNLHDRLSSFGGDICHIHYVNWNNDLMVCMLEANQFGSIRKITFNDVKILKNRQIFFGKGAGAILNTLALKSDGTIGGKHHDNESLWEFDKVLIIKDKNGVPTSRFDSVLSGPGGFVFIMGLFLGGGMIGHFIIIPRSLPVPGVRGQYG
jgi:hypothetical protein